MLRALRFSVHTSVLVGILASCGSEKRDGFDPNANANGGGPPNGGGQFDSKDAGDAAAPAPEAVGWLTGKVVAPEGTVPIRGALLYLTKTLPTPIPDGVQLATDGLTIEV